MIYEEAIKLQKEVVKEVVAKDDFDKVNHICGVDVAYNNDIAYWSAVLMGRDSQLLESVDTETVPRHPYVPGF